MALVHVALVRVALMVLDSVSGLRDQNWIEDRNELYLVHLVHVAFELLNHLELAFVFESRKFYLQNLLKIFDQEVFDKPLSEH